MIAWRVTPVPSLSRVIESGPSADRRPNRLSRVASPSAANTGTASVTFSAALAAASEAGAELVGAGGLYGTPEAGLEPAARRVNSRLLYHLSHSGKGAVSHQRRDDGRADRRVGERCGELRRPVHAPVLDDGGANGRAPIRQRRPT